MYSTPRDLEECNHTFQRSKSKLVTKKKIHAPKSAPEILKLKLVLNSCETKPIINTLPK